MSNSEVSRAGGFATLVAVGLLACTQVYAARAIQVSASANEEKPTALAALSGESSSRPVKSARTTRAVRDGASAKPTDAPASQAAPPADDLDTFRIGIDDELQISVWHEQELSMPVVVRPDGMITLPLLNDVPVLGLTTQELQALLTEKLKLFVTEPQVTVSARAIRSRKVFLVGQVPRPGVYQLSGRRTVLQMLAEGGGLNLFAKRSSIYILRNDKGHQVRIPFNYKNAIKGGSDAQIVLLPGDMVVVP